VPPWGGEQAGLPGKLYAKILRDTVSGEFPVVSYWKPTTILSDNRIPALGIDQSLFVFASPTAGEQVTISAEVYFRRMFSTEAERRGWDSSDILMEATNVDITIAHWEEVYIPLILR
jgi:hypothetical protein